MIEEIDVNMDSEQLDVPPMFSSTPIKSKPLEKTTELHLSIDSSDIKCTLYITLMYGSEEDDILNITSLSQSSDNLNQSYRILDDTVSVHRSSPSESSSSDVGSDSHLNSLSECSLSDGNSDKDSDENITFFEIEEEDEHGETSESTSDILVQPPPLPSDICESSTFDNYFVSEQPRQSPPKTFFAPNVKQRSHELKREEHNVKHEEQIKLAKSTKIICTLDLLLQIFQGKCRHPTCNDKVYTKHTLIGTCVLIEWTCHSGHAGKFYSSYDCNRIAATNLQTAAFILLSGNIFYKMEKFARFLGLSFISSSTFFRFQRLYCLPVINEWWEWHKGFLQNKLRGKKIVVSGDGHCDSPGYSPKNLCYFLMEMETDYIIDLHIAEKTQTDLKSANMEREALKIILNRLKNVLDVREVVTDASSSIIKMLEDEFKNIFHSLDVWHNSKNIRKAITKICNKTNVPVDMSMTYC
ncbi:Hypothetical predicted protein [Paramuricea clavata]|uniref:Uncharacterized protein n=1 Tax=Paramuricea clavata TaxID=317549 RepID=A0A7D9ED50_PARCT|nr:Hypothetical predicted protein [Paramuricea clavata]